jgi:hypothetical protein
LRQHLSFVNNGVSTMERDKNFEIQGIKRHTATFHRFKLCQRVMVDIKASEDDKTPVETMEETRAYVVRLFEAELMKHSLVDRPLKFTREIEPPTIMDFILRRKRRIEVNCLVKVAEILKDAPSLARGPDGEEITVHWIDIEPTISESTQDHCGKVINLERGPIIKL